MIKKGAFSYGMTLEMAFGIQYYFAYLFIYYRAFDCVIMVKDVEFGICFMCSFMIKMFMQRHFCYKDFTRDVPYYKIKTYYRNTIENLYKVDIH